MFGPAILPVQLTVVFLLVSTLIAVAPLSRFGHRPRKILRNSCFASIILFVPACLGIGFLIDLLRYGEFSFHTAAEVSDPYVKLPVEATEITLFKFASGHDVRFRISVADLKKWMAVASTDRNEGRFRIDATSRPGVPQLFQRHGWTVSDDVDFYQGTYSPRGAGFDVWYSPEQGVAYLHATYW